ncbi:MAG: hypothetical protein ACUVX8_19180 [Candidatus Zipacnadales bacterium]
MEPTKQTSRLEEAQTVGGPLEPTKQTSRLEEAQTVLTQVLVFGASGLTNEVRVAAMQAGI